MKMEISVNNDETNMHAYLLANSILTYSSKPARLHN